MPHHSEVEEFRKAVHTMMKAESKRRDLIQVAVIAAVTAVLSFGYFVVKDKGFFVVVDDFNFQQIPFATAVWNALHGSPMGQWIWQNDLGSSLNTGFSFYNLGSPFFWIMYLLPPAAGFLIFLHRSTC